jgi:hypothetical protein
MLYKLKNFLSSDLAGPLSSGDSLVRLYANDLPKWPNPVEVGPYNIVIRDVSNPLASKEIARVMSKDSEGLTVERAQEGTQAQNFENTTSYYQVLLTPTESYYDGLLDVSNKIDFLLTGNLDLNTALVNIDDNGLLLKMDMGKLS